MKSGFSVATTFKEPTGRRNTVKPDRVQNGL